MRKVKLYLEDLSCPDCAKKIEKILNKTEGVNKADVHFTTGKANVEYDPESINIEGLKDAVSTTGYQVIKVR
jgi:Cu+-exporting ATPase